MRKMFAVLIAGLCLASCQPRQESNDGASAEENAAAEKRIEERRKELEEARDRPLKWQYESDENAMGNTNKRAVVQSLNTVNLASPYDGEQRGKILVRHHSEYGKDVLFSIEQGQIVGDEIGIRFDDEKAFTLSFLKPEDGSSELVFLSYPKLIAKLRTAKKVAIQATIYDNASQVFEFNIAGLDMTKLD